MMKGFDIVVSSDDSDMAMVAETPTTSHSKSASVAGPADDGSEDAAPAKPRLTRQARASAASAIQQKSHQVIPDSEDSMALDHVSDSQDDSEAFELPKAQAKHFSDSDSDAFIILSDNGSDDDHGSDSFVASDDSVKPVKLKAPVKRAAAKSPTSQSKSSRQVSGGWGAVASDAGESSKEDPKPRKKSAKPKASTSKKPSKQAKGKGKAKETEESSEVESDESSGVSDNEDVPLPAAAAAKAGPPKKKKTKLRRPKGMNHFERNQWALVTNHPELADVWGDLEATVEIIEPIKAPQPPAISQKLLPFQLEGLHWMQTQEAGLWKVADEMGMGKTIQTISLICSDHDPSLKGKNKRMTLVVAPTVAIVQWRNEFQKFTKGFKVDVWHGNTRASSIKALQEYDVILTSYAVMESVYRRQEKGFTKNKELCKEDSVLHQIKWHRIILDEAHNIKDRACNTAKAAFALRAKFRWCLSGTPLQNRVGELYSLIRFLGVLPFAASYCKSCPCTSLHWSFSNRKYCDDCGHTPMQHVWFWNNEILKPIQKFGHMGIGATAFKKLKSLLDRMMLRRTKLERADDLSLPPRVVLVRRDYFTEEEEELYTSLYSDVQRKFGTYLDQNTVLNNYANIFTLITRMRQMACHPDLVLKSKTSQTIGTLLNNKEEDFTIQTCRICLDEAEDPIMSKCRHLFCRECIREVVEGSGEHNAPECPVCHVPMVINLEGPAVEFEGATAAVKTAGAANQGMLDRIDPSKWRTSTKIEALVEELNMIRSESHTSKALVFSQSTSFLDLIARRLQLAGFKLARLQGTMTPEQRDRTIRYFTDTTDVTVFLLSLKAGGVALNLVEANYVFLVDPWWNPAVEYQAMDRIHRIGQRRPVICKRLIIENSIESRILELQKKKENMIGAAFGDQDAVGRLTQQDMQFLFTL